MYFHSFFEWLLQTTLQASVLISLILLIHRALGHRLGVRGRYFLWLVLLVRMALPWAPQSHLSVYNLLPLSPPEGYRLSTAGEAGSPTSTPAATDRTTTAIARGRAGSTPDGIRGIEPEPREGQWPGARTILFLSLLWFVGAGGLAGYILAGSIRLWRIVRRAQPVTDRQILDLLEECKSRIGTRTKLAVVATDRISCPALFGFVRPRLLLPGSATTELSLDELRHVFLHELAHLKRHDILVGAVTSVLHVLHWFNPLIALGLQRMRADRELACDALAMSVLDPNETCAYGRTIVRQLEQLLTLRPRPLLAALSGDRARIRQRIAMIIRFRREAYRWSPLMIALIGCLACVALTNGRAVVPPSETPEALALENQHTNIVRVHIRHKETGQYLVANGDTVTCDAAEPGDRGLWEARFDGSLGHTGTVLFYSVATGRYLTTDAQGSLAVAQSVPEEPACWIVRAGPLGVQVISKEFKWRYIRLDEDGQVRAPEWGRDLRSQWDVIQLGRIR
jgi:beta-lactamase regulating signal transducer with metallopeptidase domain